MAPKYRFGLKPKMDLNEEYLVTLLPNTTESCQEDIQENLLGTMSRFQNRSSKSILGNMSPKCEILYTYFITLKEVKECDGFGNNRYFSALNNLLLAKMNSVECGLYPTCTLTHFFKECWIKQLDGLHYIPPIMTDLTPADKDRFESRLLKFSNESVKNVCCLVKRATSCEEQFINVNCTFAIEGFGEDASEYIKDTFMEIYWKTTVRPLYLVKTSEVLRCEELESEIDVCATDQACCICFQLGLVFFVILSVV